ncbi:MAG: citrate lyase holo-[acyl-carrier protein] synthase [Synergistaceae bacterium]|nr:citrate lyase holo-[acyl-carrier protein] synthase [Synergistaceae bacterium]
MRALRDQPQIDSDIGALLAAREERAWLQKYLLRALCGFGGCVVQFSLNIPGWPKRLDGDTPALRACAEIFTKRTGDLASPIAVFSLTNAAGAAIISAFSAYGGDFDLRLRLKSAAVQIEEDFEWGRVLDIDVIAIDGPLSRSLAGIAARRCFFCGEDAKICARTQAHPITELRGRAGALIRLAASDNPVSFARKPE